MNEKKITIEVSIKDAHDLSEQGCVNHAVHVAVADALAEHDAAENHLSLPWLAVERFNTPRGWCVRDCHGYNIANCLTEAQAKLIAATREALAEHKRESNPLGLPWHAVDSHDSYDNWTVHDCHGKRLAKCLTKAQANLIAAAPEMGDELQHLFDNAVNPASIRSVRILTVLKKAGR